MNDNSVSKKFKIEFQSRNFSTNERVVLERFNPDFDKINEGSL